jgi:hypothetical protein
MKEWYIPPSVRIYDGSPDMNLNLAVLGATLVALLVAAVLVAGALLFVRLKIRGQLNRMLLRTVANPKTRESYLKGATVISVSFLFMGVLFVLMTLNILDAQIGAVLTAVAFATGIAGIVFQIRISKAYVELPLENFPELKELVPQIFEAANTPEVYCGLTPSPLYDQFALDQARFEVHRRTDALIGYSPL